MYEARYLLSIEELMKDVSGQDTGQDLAQGSGREALFQRASFRVDEERRERAGRMGTARARAACLGGGLLLQLAVGEAARAGGLPRAGNSGLGADSDRAKSAMPCCGPAFDGGGAAADGGSFGGDASGDRTNGGGGFGIKRYSVTELLERLEDLPYFPLAYRYGENGKPYFRDYPFYFNLSHSGDYVLCAISAGEIGADIQQRCGKNAEKIAGRFFSKQEAEAIATEQTGEEREKLFYRLWSRKEAYGKLTGKGISDVLEMELLPWEVREPQGIAGSESANTSITVLPDGRCLLWEEFDIMKEVPGERHPEDNYSIAFCQFGAIL